ncbi:unnamed protein product [Gongylonema pulchrum]|uniref:RGS domain-containing protein n=1 Tax=Gongylonema pulchrum TaxID=637853 RepID=A0A183ES03_9BILA|nr:unnamed protein product [Gongylonema pulchrum]
MMAEEMSREIKFWSKSIHLAFNSAKVPFQEKEYYDNDCCKRGVNFANWLIKYDDPTRLSDKDCKYLLTSGEFYESYRYFDEYRDEVKEMLTCNLTILTEVARKEFQLFR